MRGGHLLLLHTTPPPRPFHRRFQKIFHHTPIIFLKPTNSNIKMSPDEMIDSIEAMCRQEERGYQKSDYLEYIRFRYPLHHDCLMDETCRLSMIKWTATLVEHCEYDRQTFDIAISCLDRFLSTPKGSEALLASDKFQLASMTALYMSAKIHESRAIEPESIARLSRGVHTKEAVEEMELVMLKALRWQVNPPTAIRFSNVFLDLVPFEMIPQDHRALIIELVRHQLDASISDYQSNLQRNSHIGLAALVNAIECQESGGNSISTMVQSKIGMLLPAFTEDSLWHIRSVLAGALAKEVTLHQTPKTSCNTLLALAQPNHCRSPSTQVCGNSSPRAVAQDNI